MMQSPLEIPKTFPVLATEQTVGVEDSKEFGPPLTPAEFVTEIVEPAPAVIADIGPNVNVWLPRSTIINLSLLPTA